MKDIFEKLPKQTLVHQQSFASTETPKQESFKVALKAERLPVSLRESVAGGGMPAYGR